MSTATSLRPVSGEYAPDYEGYISVVPAGDIIQTIEKQTAETSRLLSTIEESRGSFRYAEGKWSIKEVIGHVIDCERVFSYRVLRFSRNDATALPGFEQDDYVKYARSDARTIADLAREYSAVRESTLALLRSLDEDAWSRRGTSNENPVSVRALAFIIAGHERHHVEVLKERYLR